MPQACIKWYQSMQAWGMVGAFLAGAMAVLTRLVVGRRPHPRDGLPAPAYIQPADLDRTRADLASDLDRTRLDLEDVIRSMREGFNARFDNLEHDLREWRKDYSTRLREAEMKVAVLEDRGRRPSRRD
jgi:hypothetical protein